MIGKNKPMFTQVNIPSPVLRLPMGRLPQRVIVCGDAERAATIAGKLGNSERIAARREYVAYTGTYRSLPIGVVAHGVGAAGAAICFEEIFRYGARAVIRIGTCGSYDQSQRKGDLIIGTGATAEDGVTTSIAPQGFPAVSDHNITAALASAAGDSIRCRTGILRTRAAFYPGVIPDPASQWAAAGAIGVEMELATLLTIAARHRARAGGIFVIDGFPLGDASMAAHDQTTADVDNGKLAAIDIALEAIVALPERLLAAPEMAS